MDEINYDFIFLIISSDDLECYSKMRLYAKQYLSLFKDKIKFFFIELRNDLDVDICEKDDYIFVKGEESIRPGISVKTIESMKYVNENYKYDYLIRTNLSTLWNVNNLLNFKKSLPKYNFAGGFIMFNTFISGTGIILSEDVSIELCKSFLITDEYDDVVISNLIRKLGYSLFNISDYRIEYLTDNNPDKILHTDIENILYYRIKNDKDRNIDLQLFKRIFSSLYNRVMNKLNISLSLLCKNQYPGKDSSDIMEHLQTLYKYSSECDSVFETGVRGCVSSYAFLYGLLNGNTNIRKKLFMNDINVCDINEITEISRDFNIDVKYEWKNNLLLELNESYDITFIDTWHVYGQLKRELDKFSKITNKYIIMHDTTVDGIYGETIRNNWNAEEQSKTTGFSIDEINKGLMPAIEEFLETNTQWYIKEMFTNNNGLTILAKK
jgi:hypothetical protein